MSFASVEQVKNSPVVTKTTAVVDSKFRTTGTLNEFTYDLGITIDNVQLIEITSVDFVNILENINVDNNKLNWVDSLGVTHFDTITPGNYNTTNLVSAIGTIMTSSTTNDDYYTVSVNFNTNLITFTNSKSNTFDLLFGTSQDESIGEIIGFGTTSCFGITQQEGSEALALYPTKHIFIGSTIIQNGSPDSILTSNGVSNSVYIVNVDGIYSEIIHQDLVRSFKKQDESIRVIDFCLQDDNAESIIVPETLNEEKGTFVVTIDIYSGIFDLTYYD